MTDKKIKISPDGQTIFINSIPKYHVEKNGLGSFNIFKLAGSASRITDIIPLIRSLEERENER